MATRDHDPDPDFCPPSYEEALTFPKVRSISGSIDITQAEFNPPPPPVPEELGIQETPDHQIRPDSRDTVHLIEQDRSRQCSLRNRPLVITIAVLATIIVVVPLTYFSVSALNKPRMGSDVLTITSTTAPSKGPSWDSFPNYVSACLLSPRYWLQYNFHTHTRTPWSGCNGKRYVTWHSPSQLFVGVILCDSTSYQIMLGESLGEPFLNIGSVDGNGAEHCAFVGAPRAMWRKPAIPRADSFRKEGFLVDSDGRVRRGTIGGNVHYYLQYVCGVPIPGNNTEQTAGEHCDIDMVESSSLLTSFTYSRTYGQLVRPTIYQCQTTDISSVSEVHVLAVSSSSRSLTKSITVKLSRIPGLISTIPVTLMLISQERVTWKISKQDSNPTDIYQVVLISMNGDSNVVSETRLHSYPVLTHTGNYGYGSTSNSRSRLKAFVKSQYGAITSFHGLREASSLSLKI